MQSHQYCCSARRRHRETLPHPSARRRWLLHRAPHHIPYPAGACGALQQGCRRPLRLAQQTLRPGKTWSRVSKAQGVHGVWKKGLMELKEFLLKTDTEQQFSLWWLHSKLRSVSYKFCSVSTEQLFYRVISVGFVLIVVLSRRSSVSSKKAFCSTLCVLLQNGVRIKFCEVAN